MYSCSAANYIDEAGAARKHRLQHDDTARLRERCVGVCIYGLFKVVAMRWRSDGRACETRPKSSSLDAYYTTELLKIILIIRTRKMSLTEFFSSNPRRSRKSQYPANTAAAINDASRDDAAAALTL